MNNSFEILGLHDVADITRYELANRRAKKKK